MRRRHSKRLGTTSGHVSWPSRRLRRRKRHTSSLWVWRRRFNGEKTVTTSSSISDAWPSSVRAAIPELAEALARLNQHAENTRYPHPGVSKARAPYLAPHEDYEPGDSKQALEDARAVVDVCVNLAAEAKRFADGLGSVLGASA